ncbi:MAG: 1,4-alpha-glucan branching protein GlgB [Clostridia bacterium]|nr:1,4-alpha-glucan branching protein GlgB [Clostridia bacterium]
MKKPKKAATPAAYIDETAMYLFNQGVNYESYRMLGANKILGKDGKEGYLFAVWAPNAVSVSVVCDGNGWDRSKGKMYRHENSGIWEVFVPGVQEGQNYKYSIETRGGDIILKADPYAFYSEVRPANASVTTDLSYTWKDQAWMQHREVTPPYNKPMSIYEMHFGSWQTREDGSYYTYAEMIDRLIPYLTEMGYTHVELMPICEYPFDGSWGYQVTGYYSANSRYGKPTELKALIDALHQNGIGVIMDWVPAHFPRDAHGLANFDGTPLFEHPDSRRGEHKEWGTLVFDWTKSEIFSFLISNALFWLKEYHMDGLRVDAVSSMLYLDYNRRDGEWLPNKYGGKENLEAIDFLQKLNSAVFERCPNVLMIAEESTAWGGVTKPAHEGGLGFNFKWNMGWMHDVLDYMQCDPLFRKGNHNKLTFPMMYAFAENYILALSHDEVVHGKRSLLDKMWGSYDEKFAQLRLLYAFMYAHPGKKLLFMGGEFGQFVEWRFAEQLDWMLEGYESHAKLRRFSAELNHFYGSHPSFYEIEREQGEWKGFRWLNAEDAENSVLSFLRKDASGKESIAVILNFTPVERQKYLVGVPEPGEYEVILSTNAKVFGGDGKGSKKVKAKKKAANGYPYSIALTLPPLTGFYLKYNGIPAVTVKKTPTKKKKS